MIRSVPLMVFVAGFWAAAHAETPAPVLVLKGLDPIALADGKETPGLETIETTYGRFKYRFATAENKKAFEAKPEERAVQFGGACGRMGPFSGTGNTERFVVHARRIYVFASESCRDAFRRDPEKFIERPNLPPEGTPEQTKRGAELVTKALDGFGGAKVVDAVKALPRPRPYRRRFRHAVWDRRPRRRRVRALRQATLAARTGDA